MGYSEMYLRDNQYDVVLHMTSCAVGASDYFECDDEEIIDAAKEKDTRIKMAWTGHPKLKIVNNSDIFQDK